jgi:hypothetical protein
VAAENVISDDPYMHQILYQYSNVFAPVLVLGTLYAISKQTRAWVRNSLTIVALACAITTCALWGYAPFSHNQITNGFVPESSIRGINYLEKELPPNAVVSAWYPIVTHIDERVQVYVWPTPFSASNWGLLNDTGKRLRVSSEVQYILLPLQLDPNDQAVFKKIADDYHLIDQRSGFALYEKIGSS